MVSLNRRRLFARWIILCALAELLGIASAAVWYGGVNILLGEPAPIPARIGVWLLMSMAAIPEGIILGGLQAVGVKWFVPTVSVWRWVMATVIVGLLGWGIGTFIPMFIVADAAAGASTEPSLGATAAYAATFGLAVGAVFGLAQSWALPTGLKARISWVVSNAFGWAIGLPLIYAAAQVASDYSTWPSMIGIWALGGLGAGLSVGLATGIALLKITARSQ